MIDVYRIALIKVKSSFSVQECFTFNESMTMRLKSKWRFVKNLTQDQMTSR